MSQEDMNNTPLSREESCLKNCVEGLGTEGLPRPLSRTERYLHALAAKLAGGITPSEGEIVEVTEVDTIIVDPSTHEDITLETTNDGGNPLTIYYAGDFVIPSLEAAKESSLRTRYSRDYGYQRAVEYNVSGHKVFVFQRSGGGVPYVVSTPVDNLTLMLNIGEYTFPKRGLYLAQESSEQYAIRYTGPVIKTKMVSNGPDWSDITNKPFGDETITEIEWDGEIGDKITVDYPAGHLTYVLVSELNIPAKDIKYASTVLDGRQVYVGQFDSQHFVNSHISNLSGVTFPKKGIYFPKYTSSDRWTKKIVLNEPFIVNTKTLPAKFVPKDAIRWDDIVDKPFYHRTGSGSGFTTIEWDGEIGDRLAITGLTDYYGDTDVSMVYMGDYKLILDNIIDGSCIGIEQSMEGQTQSEEIPLDGNYMVKESGLVLAQGFVYSPSDNFEADIDIPYMIYGKVTFPKTGVYFFKINMAMDGVVIGSMVTTKLAANMHYTASELKKIDEKFLPEPLAYDRDEAVTAEETIEFDGVVGDRVTATGATMFEMPCTYVRLSDGVLATKEDALAMGGTMVQGNESMDQEPGSLPEESIEEGDGYISFQHMLISVFEDNSTIELVAPHGYAPGGTVTFPKKGVYTILLDMGGGMLMYFSKLTANLTRTIHDFKKIDPKFLPDTIAPKELILTSSTEGSTKQFKITVADDGTLTATEVV